MLEIQRFIQKHGITTFKFNPHFPVNTLAIMRGAVAAELAGCLPTYVNAMYSAMWEQRRNMNDEVEIVAVLNSAGLDVQALLQAAQSPDVKARLLASTQTAFERGAFGSPTFFVGNEMYFGKDRLREVEMEIVGQLKHT